MSVSRDDREDLTMAMITNDWLTALGGEFHKPYYRQLFEFVKDEYNTTVVFPPADDIFNAFHLTPLSKVKVVILGQDPYHNVGQAHGLCFSVKPDVDIPPSLVNIYQELHDDLGCYIPNNGYLVKWAEQGVLMLNTVLTVRAHMANSHHGKGWEEFTDAAIRALNAQDRPIVFILWGRPAQMKKSMLNVITLALVLINLVLTVILTFSIVSTTKKTDNLITKVAEIIDLDVGGGISSNNSGSSLAVSDMETVDVKNSDDSTKITLSLLDSNNKIHYAQVSVVLTLNKKSRDYSEKRSSIDSGMQLIVNNVNTVVSSYTYDTALQNKSNMEAELLSKLQNLFQTDMIHSVAINLVIS